ncbi:hypothetical protein SDC9_135912 [bioreactor metagenome]|uniref:Uncharacterized protein n=1 Tax=bioreactor metagenome TaxID=1076179 RepID=A0A645DIG7_9ZZZZ
MAGIWCAGRRLRPAGRTGLTRRGCVWLRYCAFQGRRRTRARQCHQDHHRQSGVLCWTGHPGYLSRGQHLIQCGATRSASRNRGAPAHQHQEGNQERIGDKGNDIVPAGRGDHATGSGRFAGVWLHLACGAAISWHLPGTSAPL